MVQKSHKTHRHFSPLASHSPLTIKQTSGLKELLTMSQRASALRSFPKFVADLYYGAAGQVLQFFFSDEIKFCAGVNGICIPKNGKGGNQLRYP